MAPPLFQRLRELAEEAPTLGAVELSDRLEALALELRASATEQEQGSSRAAAGGDECEAQQTSTSEAAAQQPYKKQRREKPTRVLDFSKYRQRYVAIEVMYLGGGLHGFARQDNTENTIEGLLFKALRQTKLIQEDADISSLNYSRCGRTDKGVSALGQVVALTLRSSGKAEEPELPEEREMDYIRVLNRALPSEVRALGWTTAPEDFNARFSARYRQYKYFIVQQMERGGAAGAGCPTLDIERMQEACQHFLGEHDFRNFCKPDVGAVKSFRRHVMSFTIDQVGVADSVTGTQIYALNLKGTAFLWHQVRCMAAVLLMVGRGQEAPEIVKQLLDLEAMPCKPQYQMAAEEPLLLYACHFEGLSFRRTARAAEHNMATLTAVLERNLVASALVSACIRRMDADAKVAVPGEQVGLASGHVRLMARPREPSVEERARRMGIPWPPASFNGDVE